MVRRATGLLDIGLDIGADIAIGIQFGLLVKPEKPLFVLAEGLHGDVYAKLRALGMTVAGPFLTGRPNVPSLVELAAEHGLTVLR